MDTGWRCGQLVTGVDTGWRCGQLVTGVDTGWRSVAGTCTEPD